MKLKVASSRDAVVLERGERRVLRHDVGAVDELRPADLQGLSIDAADALERDERLLREHARGSARAIVGDEVTGPLPRRTRAGRLHGELDEERRGELHAPVAAGVTVAQRDAQQRADEGIGAARVSPNPRFDP